METGGKSNSAQKMGDKEKKNTYVMDLLDITSQISIGKGEIYDARDSGIFTRSFCFALPM
jgi:hypothetical protein